jgi:hypothetical protein
LIKKKDRAYNFSNGFFTRNFWGPGGMSRYAAIPMIVALSLGVRDITRFRPSSPIATENHVDRAKRQISKR